MNCDLCDSTNSTFYLNKNNFDLLACIDCGLITTHIPVQENNFYKKYYTEDYFKDGKNKFG